MEKLKKINSRAYDIYEARLHWNIPGDSLSDWLQAESEINHVTQYHIRYGIIDEINQEIKKGV